MRRQRGAAAILSVLQPSRASILRSARNAAGVLETLAAQNSYAPEMQTTILRAASGLRAATNKAQALLAITQCQSVIATALKQAVASGGFVRGFGRADGLGHIARVIAQTVRLIQTKG